MKTFLGMIAFVILFGVIGGLALLGWLLQHPAILGFIVLIFFAGIFSPARGDSQ